MNTNYVDTSAITQVIGCVFNDVSLLDDTEQYIIHEEDFVEPFHKIVFGSIYNIHQSGSQVNIDAVIDYLANRPKFEAIFKQNNGVDYLLEVSQRARPDTFNYYYNRLKKFTLLRAYDSYGVNVSELYDPTNILDTKKRQQQEDWLDATSLVDIANAIDKRIDEIKSKYIEDDLGIECQAGDNINELIDKLMRQPEVGIPMYGALINTVTKGARLRKYYLRSAPTGVGKAIPNNTIIPTPQGNKRIDQIKVNDYLFGDDGQPTKVLAVYPQKQKKQVYIIEFEDGRQVRCCKDHLWEYTYKDTTKVESTEEILTNGLKDANGNLCCKIKINGPLQYTEKDLPLDPYILGLLLHNGTFVQYSCNSMLQFSCREYELIETIIKTTGWECEENNDDDYYFNDVEIENELIPLFNLKTKERYIPKKYFEASVEQRYALLQGLMDMGGSINVDGSTYFTTSSYYMANDIINLCRGLGLTAFLEENIFQTNTYSTVCIQCRKELKPKLFCLKRKLEIAEDYAASNNKSKYEEYLYIKNIYPINDWVDMTCFTVDNESHLFLINDYIVTHNTRAMIADACNFACCKIYHEQFGWIKNGGSQPTLYIATEQDKEEIQTMMLAFISNVNEDHIINGRYLEGELERVKEAADIIKESPLWIEWLPDFSLKDVENKIKKHIRNHNVRYVLSES